MDGWMDGQTNGWVNDRMDGGMSKRVDGWIDVAGQTDGRTNGQLNKWKQRLDGQMDDEQAKKWIMDGWMNRWTGGQVDDGYMKNDR